MSVKIKLTNFCYDDYVEYPEYTLIEITKEELNRLKEIGEIVEKNKLKGAIGDFSLFNNYPTFFDGEHENEYTEGNEVIINSVDFHIRSTLKNTCYDFFSNSIGFKEIESLLTISEMPIEHMGMYINDKDENIRNIAIERLSYKP